ncbi:MAG: hypothetical protein Q9214_000262 [Letrouitia sp. 1 TL-2023]
MAKKRDRRIIGSTTPNQAADRPAAVYRAMLAEVGSPPAQIGEEGKAVKKRRVKGRIIEQRLEASTKNDSDAPNEGVPGSRQASKADFGTNISSVEDSMPMAQQQTAYNDETDESSENEMDWEEVDLSHELNQRNLDLLNDHREEGQEGIQEENLNLVLKGDSDQAARKITVRRKPVSSAEKKMRLEIHKMHVTCLLSHVHLRNHWCNDEDIQKTLFRRLPKKTVSNLNPEESYSQFRKDQMFKQGLEEANQMFRDAFIKTARGIRRPYWAEDLDALPEPPSDLELPMQKCDFLDAATSLKGSRDVGAQLFCALLRSAAVGTRLICSLQPLPFSAVAKGIPMRHTPRPIPVVDHTAQLANSSDRDTSPSKPSTRASTPTTRHSRSVTRPNSLPPRPNKIIESPFPIFWTEVFNPFAQKWTPLDPLVTKTLFKPSKLAPPLSDPFNTLSYAIAFEDNLSAYDVTRRYTSAYNAKIRKQRIESTRDGAEWLARVMKMFTPQPWTRKRGEVRDREQIETAELARREAAEGMPRNVADFKDHPYYALERHLRRNEVVWPKREVGKVAAGRAAGGGVARRVGVTQALSEPIYRRSDVQVCRSADNWYRVGRKIKAGEQPLKHVAARRKAREASFHDVQEAGEAERREQEGLGLYALHQTEVYVPPAIPEKGYPIPKNLYGNLDVYVPSMVPARGVHIRHPRAALAAKVLGVDYADAVTGFSFKGRHGTAVVAGAVIWEGHKEGVKNVIEGLEDEDKRAREDKKAKVVLGYWKRWLQMLRIRERVEGYAGEGSENNKNNALTDDIDDQTEEDSKSENEEGGGFFLEKKMEEIAEPTAGRFYDGGYFAEEEEQGGGFLAEDYEETEYPIQGRARKVVQDDDEKNSHASVHEDAEEPLRELGKQGEQETLNTYSEPVPQEVSSILIEPHEEQGPNSTTERDQYSMVEFSEQEAHTVSRESHKDQKVRCMDSQSIAANDRTENHRLHSSQTEGKIHEDVFWHPCLTEEDYEEATILQELHERGELPPSLNRMPIGVSTPVEQLEENKSPEGEEIAATDRGAHLQHRDSEDEERGSLMSEDPSDEDKDPEWLL